MFCNEETAASAAAASGKTKLLRSGIDVFARRLACARGPRPGRAVTRAQMSCAEVSRSAAWRCGHSWAQRCVRVALGVVSGRSKYLHVS